MDEQNNAAANDNTGAEQQTEQQVTAPAVETPKEEMGTILGGAPKSTVDTALPDAYDLKAVLPEGAETDPAIMESFTALAKESGLNNEAAQKWAQYGLNYTKEALAAQEALITQELQKEVADWGKDAKAQLGADYDKTVGLAAVAVETLEKAVPGLREAFNETGAGNRVEFIRLFAKVGELVGEDNGARLLGGVAAQGAGSLYDKTNFEKY